MNKYLLQHNITRTKQSMTSKIYIYHCGLETIHYDIAVPIKLIFEYNMRKI
jgi:hypothetical protein